MHSLAVTRGATSEALHIQGNFASSSCYKGGLRTQFFCQLFRFWVSKMGSKKISSTPLKNIKQIQKKHCWNHRISGKNDEEICAPKIDQHEANKKNTAKSTPWYSTTFFGGWRPQMVVSFTTYGARFLPAIFASFFAKPLKYTRTQMPSECPLSHPFSNEFSFGLVPFPVRLFA